MEKLSTSSFDSRAYRPEDRLAAFQHMTAAVYHVQSLGNDSGFMVEAFGYNIGHLIFHDFKCSNARFRRTQQHLQGGDEDFLVMHAQLSGDELLQMEHGVIRLLPGHIYLRDWAYPFDSQTTDMHIRGVIIPRSSLAFSNLFNIHNPILSWSMAEPDGALLWKLWSHLFDLLSQLDLDTAETLSQGFIGFLNGLISRGDVDQLHGHSKLRSMEQHLQTQLRGDVNVEELCQRFHISRATLFRLFKEHGGVKHYIDGLRLERCYTELKSADPRRVTIGEVAAGWGYDDPSSFNRKFRQQFGLPPSRVLGSGFVEENTTHNNRKGFTGKNKPYINFKHWLAAATGLNKPDK